MLLLTIELSAVVASVSQSRYGCQRFTVATFRRLAVVLWATTAFGVIHVITEYAITTVSAMPTWDSPPRHGVPHRRHRHHQRHPDRDHYPSYGREVGTTASDGTRWPDVCSCRVIVVTGGPG